MIPLTRETARRADSDSSGRDFFLSSDDDGHWFIVPREREPEWRAWQDLDGEDERSWTAPDFAIPLGGSISLVSFRFWRIAR